MASKSDKFYFQSFVAASQECCKASDYLVACMTEYTPAKMKDMLDAMHEIEHAADEIKHEMSIALAKAFVTPIDREDLAELSQNIDEVADRIEEVLQRFYINHITSVTPEAVEFAKKICTCCALMKNMMVELENFKKPERIHQIVIELNHAEEECDRFYLDAAMKIRKQCANVLDIIAWREIYDYMENCADACEHVADCVETIVMKNT